MSVLKREKVKALLHPEVIMMVQKKTLGRLMVESALGATVRTVNGSECPRNCV